LPPYRKITAPLQIDAGTMRGFIKGQMISPMDLLDFARGVITNDVNLYQSVDQIEAMECCEPEARRLPALSTDSMRDLDRRDPSPDVAPEQGAHPGVPALLERR
jgi:hypothetical protein